MFKDDERSRKIDIKKYLDSIGAYYFMPAASVYGRAGIPDIVGAYKGLYFAIEVKARLGRLSKFQINEISDANSKQAFSMVVKCDDTFNDFKKWIACIDEWK